MCQPSEQDARKIFAGIDGRLHELARRHGDRTAAGDFDAAHERLLLPTHRPCHTAERDTAAGDEDGDRPRESRRDRFERLLQRRDFNIGCGIRKADGRRQHIDAEAEERRDAVLRELLDIRLRDSLCSVDAALDGVLQFLCYHGIFPFRRETFDFSGDFALGIKYKCLQY